jgi:TRAP transporter 4TM/12TM fusion protein
MWFGKYFPGILRFRGTNLKKFTELMIMSSDGIYGTPLYTSSSVIYYFVMFGAFFSLCGGGQVLIDIGMKASNKSSGGPAKAAVISSGLLGMISGSAVANVSTTGVMTIPMMKKVGYQPHEAGAVEAVASTGGQIMPPIMGIGAFIMAEMLGVSYIHIATSAIIPAIAYYLSIFFLVTFIAKKRDLDKKSALVAFDTKPIIPRLYLLLPAIILVYYMVIGASLMRSAMIGIFSIILINFIGLLLPGRQNYIPLRKLLSAIRDGGKQAAEIAIPTAACGIIIGIVIQSGLATKISSLIASVGISNKLIALMIGMTGCLILGMALPTVAAYLVSVVLFVPSLTGLGISPLQANMFIFYFGVLAQITPPVCLASYTAAGIAGANAMKTGWTAFKYALVAFLIPFVFVYDPSILLIGTPYQIIKGIIMTVISVYLLASGLAGYMNGKINSLLQAILIVASVLVIVPEIISSIIGIIIGIIVFIITFAKRRNIEAVSEGRVSNV